MSNTNKRVSKISDDQLVKEFVENKKMARDIAKEYGLTQSVISVRLKKLKLRTETYKKYINEKFGKLTVREFVRRDKNGHNVMKCECDCGKFIEVLCYALTNNNTTTCGCSSRKKGKHHPNFAGYEEITNTMYCSLKKGAESRGREFNITIEEIWDLYIKQDRKCALTGIDIYFSDIRKRFKFTTASLDRIDNSKGYTIDNVQWVHKKVNLLKSKWNEEELFYWCALIVKHNIDNEIFTKVYNI